MNTFIGKEPVTGDKDGSEIHAFSYPVGRYSKGYAFAFSWLLDGTRWYQTLSLRARGYGPNQEYLKATARLYRRLRYDGIVPSYEHFRHMAW